MPQVALEIRADIRNLQAEFKKLPGITEKETRKAMAQLDALSRKATASASAQARAAAAAAKKESREIASAMKGLGNSISGGLLGQLDDLTKGFGSSGLGGALGVASGGLLAVGAAGTAYVAAMSAVIAGTVALTRAAGEAADRVEELGPVLRVPDGSIASVREANMALDAMSDAAAPLTVSLGAALGPSVTLVADNMSKLMLIAQDTNAYLVRMGATVDKLWPAIAVWSGQLGVTAQGMQALSELTASYDGRLAALKTRIEETSEASVKEREKEIEIQNRIQGIIKKVEEEKAKAIAKTEDVAKPAHRNTMQRLQDEYEARDKLGALIRQSRQDMMTDADRAKQAFRERLSAAQEAYEGSAKSAQDYAMLQTALAEAEQRLLRDTTKIQSEELAKRIAASRTALEDDVAALRERQDAEAAYREQSAEAWAAYNEQRLAEAAALRQAYLDAFGGIMQGVQMLGETISAYAQQSADRWAEAYNQQLTEHQKLKEKLASDGEDMTKGERKQLRLRIQASRRALDQKSEMADKEKKKAQEVQLAMFYTNKASAIAQAIVNTALGVTQSIAQFPPPAGIPIQAMVAAAGALQIGAIAAQPPPQFYVGRQPDEQPATLHSNEAVMNARAVQAMGGADAVDALNRGGAAAMQGPQPLYIAFDGKIESRLMLRALKDPQVVAAVRSAVGGATKVR